MDGLYPEFREAPVTAESIRTIATLLSKALERGRKPPGVRFYAAKRVVHLRLWQPSKYMEPTILARSPEGVELGIARTIDRFAGKFTTTQVCTDDELRSVLFALNSYQISALAYESQFALCFICGDSVEPKCECGRHPIQLNGE
ncbi:hypothetical protein HOV04_gp04 [Xanthomonas phage XcP1]|uniref:Uncharacterized protein n=1 Tax=Xanthomonas phage XcP1 TaxID=2785027 RepID=A0A3S7L8F2_9CAUD|nr:hypothetical protein HOV04_gp04 [Xanthomonas phage XcP1]AWN08506.1 hypothetical protein XcP1_004 [Xanthomonas phage XcP1]